MGAYRWFSLVFILAFASCGKKLPELNGFNHEAWANDKNACSGSRAQMAPNLRSEKEKLLALTEMQIVELLGRPDQNELYKRNQKFFVYYLTPSRTCGTADSTSQILSLRFNAMGLVKEVSFENN